MVVLALLLAAGCKSKGPVPSDEAAGNGDAPKVVTTETGGAHPGGANPQAPMGDPHAGIDMPKPQAQFGTPDASGMLDVGAIAFKVPASWSVQRPKSSMRRAQLAAQGEAGPAEFVAFFFGPQGAGSTSDNVERWVGQFTQADGSPVTGAEQSSSTVAGFKVTKVNVAGRFASDMGAPGQGAAPQDDQRLIAAIVETPGGPYYLKLLGPNATVTAQAKTFDGLLASIVASP